MIKGIIAFCAILLAIVWLSIRIVPIAYSRAESAAIQQATMLCSGEAEVDVNSINLLSSGTVYYRYRCPGADWETGSVSE